MDPRVKIALERFELCREAESEYRTHAKEDLQFVAGDQWNWQARNVRQNAGLPCFTINRLPTFLQQITNEMRQNRPSIQVDPVSGGAVRETADILAGLIRQIEQHSDADSAYQNAAWYAAAAGKGYFRLCNEYEGYENNDQRLCIKAIDNPDRVYMDPNAKEPTGRDQEYCFIISDMNKEEYKRTYGDSMMAAVINGREFNAEGSKPGWMADSTVRVAEYYYKSYEKKTLYTIRAIRPEFLPYVNQDPSILMNPEAYETLYEYTKPPKELVEAGVATIIAKRPVEIPTVHVCTINALEVLEETVFPYKCIPVFRVIGNEFWADGKHHVSGAVRASKDSQRSLNWFTSVQAEVVGMAPKAPFIGGKGAFAGFEHNWRDVNVAPIAYLEFNDKDAKGQPITPPQRMQAEAPIQAVAQSRQMAGDDLKSVFGIFDPSLGAGGNETSGKAILARTTQSQTTNYHYYDNLVKAITDLGHVMVHVIPFFYDAERIIKIINPNGTTGTATINGMDGKNDLSMGKYDVVIQTGPTYATRRQESVEAMLTLGAGYPQAMPAIADLVVNEMDWPGAKLIADRLRAMVPPEILEATSEMGGDMEGQDPKAVMQQQKMMIQQMQGNLEALNAHAAQIEQQAKALAEELRLTKMDKEFEVVKAELDASIKNRQMDINEATTALEYQLKEQELLLEEKKLLLEESKVAITATNAMHGIDKQILSSAKDINVSASNLGGSVAF